MADRTQEGTTHGEVKERGEEEGTSGEEECTGGARSTARDLIRRFD